MKKMKLAILFASFWLIFSTGLTITTIKADMNVETTKSSPLTTAGLETIIEQKDNTEVTISYILEDKKELILKTDQENMIDIQALKEELGQDKVKENSDKKELILTLDKPDSIDFKMYIDKKKTFLLSVLNSDGELIFDYKFNELEKFDSNPIEEEDDQFEEATWTRVDKPRISKGPVIEHSDGSMIQPYLYFGDYAEAIRPNATIEQSWLQRGEKSRQNSLTAPNTAILYAEPGSRIADGPKSSTNHIYTTHYGDHQKEDFNIVPFDKSEDKPYGVPTSYTSNTLYNNVSRSDDSKRPSVAGPNKVGKSYSMVNTPKLYYRIDPKTGFEEQRLVYNQRAKWENRKGKNNPEITTTIKLSFTKIGKVVTHISYKNTGTTTINNFIGFSNHDLSLNKDGEELRNQFDEKIGNYIPMRALGNKRGMYLQSPNNEIRASIYMNTVDEPAAWAARSASRSYLATRGFISSSLIVIPIDKETYYPWKVGKKQNSGFFDDKANQYLFPYTPKGLYNSFKNQDDFGDKYKNLKSGKRLGADRESDPMWDAGLTMRTMQRTLGINETVEMEYNTMIDIPGTTFNPVVDYDYLGTNDEPQVLPLGTKKINLDGHWYDFDSNNVTLYYGIDSKEDKDIQSVLLNESQTNQEAENGKIHDFSSEIDIKSLDKGAHKIYLIAIDEDGNKSIMQEHVFNLMDVNNKEPQIAVTSPKGTKNEPYAPLSESINLKGFWSDSDSSLIKSITYKIDDEPEIVHQENIKNSKKGSLVKWNLSDLDIKKYNDFDVHIIKFKITDAEGKIGTTEFYFRHIGGSIKLVAPEEIDFGSLSVTPTTNRPVRPDLKDGRVMIEDFREKDSNPVSLGLSIDTFYKVDEDDSDDNGDDGDNADGDDGEDDNATPSKLENKPESLIHDVYWKGKLVDAIDLIVGKTDSHKNHEWFQTTDFTDEVVKNLELNFRSSEKGASIGKYVSHWTWQMIDSVD